jgi:hypothetical protein
MIDLLAFFVVGLVLGLIIDKIWYNINYSKYEKGVEFLEHYHIGIILITLSVLFNFYWVLGLGLAFILAEWTQKHYFALNSIHFKLSSFIGIGLTVLGGLLIALF